MNDYKNGDSEGLLSDVTKDLDDIESNTGSEISRYSTEKETVSSAVADGWQHFTSTGRINDYLEFKQVEKE